MSCAKAHFAAREDAVDAGAWVSWLIRTDSPLLARGDAGAAWDLGSPLVERGDAGATGDAGAALS